MKTTTILLTGLALAGALATASAREPLRVCVAEDNLPLSSREPLGGTDVEFAQRLATQLGTRAEFVWHEARTGAAEALLFEGRCDAVAGAVVDPGHLGPSRVIPGLALSQPYAQAGYVLVRRADVAPIERLSDLGERRVAVEVVSIPIYTLKQRGLKVFAVDDADAVIEAVADGRVDYGYVWGPVAQAELAGRNDVVIDERFVSDEWWNFAMAVREGETALLSDLDTAIWALRETGAQVPTVGRFGERRQTLGMLAPD